ncbi:MAG: exodeoxyribonuclease VII large subunit [Euryarchaeota archaeon]|nr:exodeoxyribonuclease VII large subunit [Euryarchaeota archaeon]
MDDRQILGMAFTVSTAGLLLLFLVSGQLQPLFLEPSEISLSHAGRKVSTAGEVVSLRFHEDGHVFFEVADASGGIKVAIFQDVARDADTGCLAEGRRVEVTGRVKEYRGAPEVVVQEPGDIQCTS